MFNLITALSLSTLLTRLQSIHEECHVAVMQYDYRIKYEHWNHTNAIKLEPKQGV